MLHATIDFILLYLSSTPCVFPAVKSSFHVYNWYKNSDVRLLVGINKRYHITNSSTTALASSTFQYVYYLDFSEYIKYNLLSYEPECVF